MVSPLPPVSLIHIGLPKTATTYLQTRWSKDPNVCLLMHGTMTLIARARELGTERSHPITATSAPPIKYDQPPQPGQKMLISNEALSNAYLNERADQEQIQCFQEQAAAQMKALVPKAKVLITVREPTGWILSIYNQAIKQGGVDTFRQFLKRERDYLERSLNIRELFVTWKQQYGSDNVLILPIELLKDNEAAFFSEIARFSGLPVSPPIDRAGTINPSLKDGHLEVMRQFNKWVRMLVSNGKHKGKLPQDLAQALGTLRFATRYALESPTPEVERRLRLFERGMRVHHNDKQQIPKELLKAIRSKIAKQLKKNDFFGYRDLYT